MDIFVMYEDIWNIFYPWQTNYNMVKNKTVIIKIFIEEKLLWNSWRLFEVVTYRWSGDLSFFMFQIAPSVA